MLTSIPSENAISLIKQGKRVLVNISFSPLVERYVQCFLNEDGDLYCAYNHMSLNPKGKFPFYSQG